MSIEEDFSKMQISKVKFPNISKIINPIPNKKNVVPKDKFSVKNNLKNDRLEKIDYWSIRLDELRNSMKKSGVKGKISGADIKALYELIFDKNNRKETMKNDQINAIINFYKTEYVRTENIHSNVIYDNVNNSGVKINNSNNYIGDDEEDDDIINDF